MSGSTRRLSVLDSTFLRIETDATPIHVAALMTFELPPDAAPDFVSSVVARFREPRPLRRPFNQVLADGPLSGIVPGWRTLDAVDMEFHVRHVALPAPGGERELGELISHLHSNRLDRTRPLWTCHVIEGLDGNRFAVYVKIHHALTDGINGIRLGTDQLAVSPAGEWRAPWHAPDKPPAKRQRGHREKKGLPPHRVPVDLGRGLLALRRTDRRTDQRTDKESEPVRVPFEAPSSVLNAPVTNARRVATQLLDLARVKAIAKRADMSMNDVFLAVCGDALRRYLVELDAVPERSLVAGVPVSLRQEGEDSANAVGFVWATLGTDVESPLERLRAVNRSMNAAKSHLGAIDPSVRPAFTLMTMALPVAVLISGQGARFRRPSMNVTISNVPGPAEELFLAGARMLACYPVSLLFQGLGLNITCVSYGGNLDVGIVGGRDALPSAQKIAVHMADALDALDAEVPR